MIMKTITMMPESQRRVTIHRFEKLANEGHGIVDISKELNIPEREITEAIEWYKGRVSR